MHAFARSERAPPHGVRQRSGARPVHRSCSSRLRDDLAGRHGLPRDAGRPARRGELFSEPIIQVLAIIHRPATETRTQRPRAFAELARQCLRRGLQTARGQVTRRLLARHQRPAVPIQYNCNHDPHPASPSVAPAIGAHDPELECRAERDRSEPETSGNDPETRNLHMPSCSARSRRACALTLTAPARDGRSVGVGPRGPFNKGRQRLPAASTTGQREGVELFAAVGHDLAMGPEIAGNGHPPSGRRSHSSLVIQ